MTVESSAKAASASNRRRDCRRNEDLQLIQRERELDAARRICEALFQHTEVDKIIEMALRATLDVLDADGGSVLLADQESKQLVFRCSVGGKPVPTGTTMPCDKGIAGAVFTSGKVEVVRDAKIDQRHYRSIDEMHGYATHDMIVFPLKRWEGDPIGVFEVMNKRDRPLDEDAIAVLTIISAFTAFAIEQARLFHEAKLAEVARLIGDISHDIKNLLMPVVCGAGLLKNEINELCQEVRVVAAGKAKASQELCNEVIAILLDDAQRINDRVKGIADCVKGLSTAPEFAPCHLAEIVESVLKPLRVVADEQGVTLRSEGLESLPPIIADGKRLYNAFYNLVNNAIPEVPAKGSVTVRGQADLNAREVLLAVVDTGRGMPPEIRDSLFTVHAISRKVGGNGLGTKIVKDVVDVHGGRITVESEEGVGTTFLVRLPLRPPSASAKSISS